MKMRTIKPIYHKGNVLTEGTEFETPEQHGRELIKIGYAEQAQDDTAAKTEEKAKAKAQSEADEKAKADADAKAAAEAEAEAKAKTK